MQGKHISQEQKSNIFKVLLYNKENSQHTDLVDYADMFGVSYEVIARISQKVKAFMKSPLYKPPKV